MADRGSHIIVKKKKSASWVCSDQSCLRFLKFFTLKLCTNDNQWNALIKNRAGFLLRSRLWFIRNIRSACIHSLPANNHRLNRKKKGNGDYFKETSLLWLVWWQTRTPVNLYFHLDQYIFISPLRPLQIELECFNPEHWLDEAWFWRRSIASRQIISPCWTFSVDVFSLFIEFDS